MENDFRGGEAAANVCVAHQGKRIADSQFAQVMRKGSAVNRSAQIIEMFENRAVFYRLLAMLYFKPLDEMQIEAFANSQLEELAEDEGSPYAKAFHDMHGALRLRHTGTCEILAADFTGAFYGVKEVKGRTAQPIQSLFQGDGGLLMGETRNEVHRALKSEALKVSEGLDLPDDHLAFICKYLARLCGDTAATVREGNFEEALSITQRQRKFFDEHVASWAFDFVSLAESFVETRFYRGVLELTSAFFAEEQVTFDDMLGLLQGAAA